MNAGERNELSGTFLDGRYMLGDRIGIGGTGVVFAATRLADGHQLVIKTLRPCFVDHPDLGRRLRREAEVAHAVVHPGIVPVLDEGTLEDGSPWIALERVHGESLSRLLLRRGTILPDEAAAIAIRTCAILHASHRAGYTHRDVKPEHILLDRDVYGELDVQLLDFGVCASPTAPEDERAREAGRVFGTPSYVSPEQASGKVDVDGRADLFSLGIVLYECLSGRLPFRASNVASLLLRIIREDAPPLSLAAPHVGADVALLVHTALARDPEKRFPSARAMARALAPLAGDRLNVERRLALGIRRASKPNRAVPTMSETAEAEAAA